MTPGRVRTGQQAEQGQARSVGERIGDLRRRAGLSQAELGGPDLDDSYISLVESGRRRPTETVLRVVAARLGCSVTYLLTGYSEGARATLRDDLDFAELALANGDAELACARFGEVIGRPDLSNFVGLERRAQWGHVLALEARGDLDQAVIEAQRYAAGLTPAEDPDQWARVHLVLCRVQRDRGALDDAARVGEHGLDTLIRMGGAWTEAMVQLGATLLAAYLHSGDLASAGALSGRLIEHAEALGTIIARMSAYWNTAILCEARGDLAGALRLIERATALLGEDNDPRNLARIRVSHAHYVLAAHPRRAAEAKVMLDRAARDLTETAAGPVDIADCRLEQARVALQLNRPADATELARTAITILSDAGAIGLVLAEAHTVLARALTRTGRHNDAITVLTDAATRLQQRYSPRLAAQAWYDLAHLHGQAGDRERELTALQHALDCILGESS
jgi:tetratricopeptide (TPR) repeat protein